MELPNVSSLTSHKIKYEDIFSSDVAIQKQVTDVYIQLLLIRDGLLDIDQPPVALPAPCTPVLPQLLYDVLYKHIVTYIGNI